MYLAGAELKYLRAELQVPEAEISVPRESEIHNMAAEFNFRCNKSLAEYATSFSSAELATHPGQNTQTHSGELHDVALAEYMT